MTSGVVPVEAAGRRITPGTIVDDRRGPLADADAQRRLVPFVSTIVVSLWGVLLVHDWARERLLLIAVGLAVAYAMASWFLPWARLPRSMQLASPFMLLGAVLALIAAQGVGRSSPFTTLLIVPMMWLALYESRFCVLIGALAVGGGVWLFGSTSGQAPPDAGVGVVVLATVGAAMGITLLQVIGQTRRVLISHRELATRFAEQAGRDPLTGLANRRLLDELLAQALQRACRQGIPLAVVFLDLDRFKVVNDSHGHAVGDAVLRVTADRLQAAVREADVVARFGGDEFVVVCEVPGLLDAEQVVERIQVALDAPVEVSDVIVRCRPSIGIADTRSVAPEPAALVAAADQAMLAVKAARVGATMTVSFNPDSVITACGTDARG